MSDRDALMRAICAHPDEDTPRLVFADYFEENDEPERAAFIRAQVELARTPPWEPFAVRCKWQDRAIASGERFSDTLPKVDGKNIAWPGWPFRRGFGWSLIVRTLSEWVPRVEPLFSLAPIGKVYFSGGVLDDWRLIASSDCLKYLREIVLVNSPIEPLWAIRDKPTACGITDIHFDRASGAGMPEVVEDLLRSVLGQGVRGLHFRVGYESLNELLDAINTGVKLDRLSFRVMGLTANHLQRLFDGPTANALTELHFDAERFDGTGVRTLVSLLPPTLRDLSLVRVDLRAAGLEEFVYSDRLSNLRRLDLSNNPLSPRAIELLSLSHALGSLRSLNLAGCRVGPKSLGQIARAQWWPNLVEIDMRGNSITTAALKHLLAAPVPPNLTVLVLDGVALSTKCRAALVKKYGDAAVFV